MPPKRKAPKLKAPKRKAPKKGKGILDNLKAVLSGASLGLYRPKGTKNIKFLPFGDEGFLTKAGVKPSDIVKLAHPKAGSVAAAVGLGKKGGAYGIAPKMGRGGANVSSGTVTADRGRVYR